MIPSPKSLLILCRYIKTKIEYLMPLHAGGKIKRIFEVIQCSNVYIVDFDRFVIY